MNTERQARCRERRKAGEGPERRPAGRGRRGGPGGKGGRGGRLASPGTAGQRTGDSRAITAERRDDLRRESYRSCGHVFRGRDESARRFTPERSRLRHAACSGPEGRRWCGSGASSTAAPRPWWATIAFPKSTRTMRSGAPSGIPRSAASRGRRGRPGHSVQAGPQGPRVTPCVEHLLRTCAPAASHRWMPRGEFAPQSASTGTGRHRWRARSICQTRRFTLQAAWFVGAD